jgi:hypothetical protein
MKIRMGETRVKMNLRTATKIIKSHVKMRLKMKTRVKMNLRTATKIMKPQFLLQHGKLHLLCLMV